MRKLIKPEAAIGMTIEGVSDWCDHDSEYLCLRLLGEHAVVISSGRFLEYSELYYHTSADELDDEVQFYLKLIGEKEYLSRKELNDKQAAERREQLDREMYMKLKEKYEA